MGADNCNSFFCPCCDRDKPNRMRSDMELADQTDKRESVCVQCASFLSIGLPNLTEKITNWGKRVVRATRRISLSDESTAATHDIKSPQKKASKPKGRMASATERNAFGYKCLALEKYIEGFIKGLEAAGLDRSAFDENMTNAINSLLSIGQKLSAERIQVSSGTTSRSDVRRLARHMDETSLMVEEYVTAIIETCAQ